MAPRELGIDRSSSSGSFSTRPGPVAPTVPFMCLTKEADMHPAIEALFDAASVETFRVVIHGVTHDDFTDGARFRPRVLPIDGAADHALTTMRSYALAFLDHVLSGAPASAVEDVRSPLDVRVQAFLP